MLKFTQEIKDNWLAAMKSGKYIQGFNKLVSYDKDSYCCIGVLGDIHPDLDNGDGSLPSCEERSPYHFLNKTIGKGTSSRLWVENDSRSGDKEYPRDYSNVIPLIEALPVQE